MRPASEGRRLAGAVLLLCGVATACDRSTEAAPKPEPSVAVVPSAAAKPHRGAAVTVRVEVATMGKSDASLDVTVPGEVKGTHDAQLASPSGGLVEALYVDEGDSVKKGQVLALVDASLRGVQLEQARVELDQAKRDAARAKALADLTSEADRERAETNVRSLQAKVHMANLELARATIKAPFAGVVAEVPIEKGEVVAPGRPVLRLVQLHPAEIDLSVPDRDVVAMTVGQEATVDVGARPGVTTGKIVHVSPAGNLETRAFTVQVEAPNENGALLPGMIANVRVKRPLTKGAVVIPQDWLVTRLDGIGVFLDVGGKAAWRPIQAKEIIRDQVVVEKGISLGDRIVIVGQRDLAEGDVLLINREGRCCEGGRAVFDSAE